MTTQSNSREYAKDGFVPTTVLPFPFDEKVPVGKLAEVDEVLRSLYKVPEPEFTLTHPQRCTLVALARLATLMGVGPPYSVLYQPKFLGEQALRNLVELNYVLNRRGTRECWATWAGITGTVYDQSYVRDTDGVPIKLVLTIKVTSDQNNAPFHVFAQQSYTELMELLPEYDVTVQLISAPNAAIAPLYMAAASFRESPQPVGSLL